MRVSFNSIKDSTISLYLQVKRVVFSVDVLWLKSLRHTYYGPEMKAKYISELHQDHQFEREHLKDVTNFTEWKNRGLHFIEKARLELNGYIAEYKVFNSVILADGMQIVNEAHPLIVNGKVLLEELEIVLGQLEQNNRILSSKGYRVLQQTEKLQRIVTNAIKDLPGHIQYRDIFDRGAVTNHFMLNEFISAYSRAMDSLNFVNLWISNFIDNRNHKIIAGIAGTGKTHTIGSLIEKIDEQGDFTIFLNGKSFDGNEVNFAQRFHERLFIPIGYTLFDTLKRLETFAKKKDRRLFIIFDALNETTTSDYGFSPIWERELQGFINLVGQFPHLYFICTLRTSYIEEIWSERPEKVAILQGVIQDQETSAMCGTYFRYYNIEVENLDTADLTHFKVPLLLDLFCKMTNGSRRDNVSVTLNVRAYERIFEGYIGKLIDQVTKARNLLSGSKIDEGLVHCSGKFMQNIEGTLKLKDFITSFDVAGEMVRKDQSIAHLMLDGNLLFLKERSGPRTEIVKHTQQLIGGYLLAMYLIKTYPNADKLVASQEFIEKINGNDPALRHQLRLDIMKFLITSMPSIINVVAEKTAFQEAWWYLYNGDLDSNKDISEQLLSNPLSLEIFSYVLQVSLTRWLDYRYPYNFMFILKYLAKFDVWGSDLNWTFHIHNNSLLFHGFVTKALEEIGLPVVDVYKESIKALFIANLGATTIRGLREMTTAYLVEFGKRYPIELLDIAKSCVHLKDGYIYQGVVHAIYGVALIRQDDKTFSDDLSVIAKTLFEFQFAKGAKHATFDYIVIDSIKHLLDLAQLKEVWTASEADIEAVRNYRVRNIGDWTTPNREVLDLVADSTEMAPPDPIGMDFRIYTIPRLITSEGSIEESEALANVLQRVYTLGYKPKKEIFVNDKRFKSFFAGSAVDLRGKVDKLGKKYNWKAFYDYAGYLLQIGQLDTFKQPLNPESGFDRLGDVEIDISRPNPSHRLEIRYYPHSLIDLDNLQADWQKEIKIETIEPFLIQEFDGVSYVMLNGVVENKREGDYKVRSFIMVESLFMEKSPGYERLREEVCPQIFNWDRDLHMSPPTDTRIYFGECYWADNMVEWELERYSVKTGKKILHKRRVRPGDIFQSEYDFTKDDLNQEREFKIDEMLGFYGEPTLMRYLNESASDAFPGFGMYIPTPKMGKYLGLKADPATGGILDEELKPCLITIAYREGTFVNEGTFIRADILKKYMDSHGFALLYQNKQHSYDIDGEHNRCMKYVLIDDF